ncbi:MAG: hypothetical protein H6741_13085 [Alphaproteobacteria bacterium]|nr:hypothetical protein [Alphaproteobacteria bacterium]
MRHLARALVAALLTLVPLSSQAQEPAAAPDDGPRFGLALNSSVNGEVYPMRLTPTATVLLGKSQLEAGVGLHPFIRKDQRVWSGELNYKYFPNGLDNAIDLYLIGRFSYVNNARETYYPTTYHYLFLNAGYGMMLSHERGSYIGTNLSVGPYTYARRSENPYEGFDDDALFDKVGFNLAFQFNVGYRF